MKPNPEAVLHLWQDFNATGRELSYSRECSIPPSQSCNAETGSSAPTTSLSRLLLFLCWATHYVKSARPRSPLLLGMQGMRPEEPGGQEDNADCTQWIRTGQTSISCTGIKVGVGGTLEISQNGENLE